MTQNKNYNWQRVNELFDAACDLPADQWETWVLNSCSDDEKQTGLHTYVIRLLHNSTKADEYFENLNSEITSELAGDDENPYQPGTQIDKYRVVREIGHGGMARVFLCERADGQFDHKVAVKIMKLKGNDELLREKFRQEQQILAGINHPHIARLYDGGITNDGFPYIIMEYVEGLPVDEYCRQNKLGIRSCLRLFMQVCSALQYAHNNLIVHHDIKPANILVNSNGQVKLLDFGIARVLEAQKVQLGESVYFEGTLQYAAPEQLQGSGPTVASDIYKLGLVLFYLITGKNFNYRDGLPSLGSAEGARKLTYTDGLLKALGMKSLLQTDLEAILRSCLAIDPALRAESVSVVNHDIQNIFDKRVLHSHPSTMAYRLRKGYVRNRAKVWMAIFFNLALVVSFAIIIDQFYKTLHQKERAEHILDFVWDVFYSVDPEMMEGDTINVYQLMENSIPEIELLDNTPDLKAELFHISGRIFTKMGFWKRGNDLYNKALQINLGLPTSNKNFIDKAIILTDMAYFHRNNSEAEIADSIVDIAISLFEQYGFRDHIDDYANAMNTKSRVLIDLARYIESISQSRKTFDIVERNISGVHIEKLRAKTHIAYAYYYLSRYDSARIEIEQGLEMIDHMDTQNNSAVFLALGVYSSILANLGEVEAAIANDWEIYNRKLKIYGENKPITLVTLSNLASKYFRMNDFERADSINLIALKHYQEQFGPYHSFTATTLLNLGNSAYKQKKFDQARDYLLRSMEADRQTLGDNHPYLAGPYQTLGLMHLDKGEYNLAEKELRQSLEILILNFGEKHRQIGDVYSHMAELYYELGRQELCAEYILKAWNQYLEFYGNDHQITQALSEKANRWGIDLK